MGKIIKPALVLFLVCLVVTAALALTYSSTKDIIEERARIDAENARKEVLSNAQTFEAIKNIEQLAQGNEKLNAIKEAYKGLADESLVGYVFTVVTKGYGGDVELMVGIDMDGKISDVKIVDHNETPGLGSKAKEEPFDSRLSGFVPGEELRVVKNKSAKSEEIEAITGATITSKAVVKGVQASVDMWMELKDKEGIQ